MSINQKFHLYSHKINTYISIPSLSSCSHPTSTCTIIFLISQNTLRSLSSMQERTCYRATRKQPLLVTTCPKAFITYVTALTTHKIAHLYIAYPSHPDITLTMWGSYNYRTNMIVHNVEYFINISPALVSSTAVQTRMRLIPCFNNSVHFISYVNVLMTQAMHTNNVHVHVIQTLMCMMNEEALFICFNNQLD